MPTKLSLGFSPCPNDTFIFDAMVNRKIDTGDFEFEVVLEDVQTLNRWAMEKKLDIIKVSYGVWPLFFHSPAVQRLNVFQNHVKLKITGIDFTIHQGVKNKSIIRTGTKS